MNKSNGESNVLKVKKKFVSIQELANRWKVSGTTVKRLIEEGELKGVRIRKTYKIDLDSVYAYEKRSSF